MKANYLFMWEQKIDIIDVMPNCQVPLRNDSYTLHKILTNNEDLLVSLMMVEKMPDSNYEMIGELDKEIKEVTEWPVKHPELFWSTGHSTTEVNVSAWTTQGLERHCWPALWFIIWTIPLIMSLVWTETEIHQEGARMVRKLLAVVWEHSLCNIFMAKIDSIGSSHLEEITKGGSKVRGTMMELFN